MAVKSVPKKSATSTETVLWPVQAKATDGSLQNVTSATASIGYRLEADTNILVPTVYVATGVAWQTWAGPRYMLGALLGPLATINPPGPTGGAATPLIYEVWAKLVLASEDVRFPLGLLIVGP